MLAAKCRNVINFLKTFVLCLVLQPVRAVGAEDLFLEAGSGVK